MNQSVVYSRWLQPACLVGLTAPVRQALRDGTAKASTLTDLIKRMDAAGCAGPSAAAAARPVANAAPPTRQVLNASKALLKTLYSRPAANKNPANKNKKKAKNAKKFTVARFVNASQAGPKPFNARRKFVVTNDDLEGPVLEGPVKTGTSAGKTTPAQPPVRTTKPVNNTALMAKLEQMRPVFERMIAMPWMTEADLRRAVKGSANGNLTKKDLSEAMRVIEQTPKFQAAKMAYSQLNELKVLQKAPGMYRTIVQTIHADITQHAPRSVQKPLLRKFANKSTKASNKAPKKAGNGQKAGKLVALDHKMEAIGKRREVIRRKLRSPGLSPAVRSELVDELESLTDQWDELVDLHENKGLMRVNLEKGRSNLADRRNKTYAALQNQFRQATALENQEYLLGRIRALEVGRQPAGYGWVDFEPTFAYRHHDIVPNSLLQQVLPPANFKRWRKDKPQIKAQNKPQAVSGIAALAAAAGRQQAMARGL